MDTSTGYGSVDAPDLCLIGFEDPATAEDVHRLVAAALHIAGRWQLTPPGQLVIELTPGADLPPDVLGEFSEVEDRSGRIRLARELDVWGRRQTLAHEFGHLLIVMSYGWRGPGKMTAGEVTVCEYAAERLMPRVMEAAGYACSASKDVDESDLVTGLWFYRRNLLGRANRTPEEERRLARVTLEIARCYAYALGVARGTGDPASRRHVMEMASDSDIEPIISPLRRARWTWRSTEGAGLARWIQRVGFALDRTLAGG